MNRNDKIKILLVDDDDIMHAYLKILIKKQADIEVVGEADCGETGFMLAQRLLPDVVVMDVSMPGIDGIEASRQIMTDNPRIRILLLSSSLSEHIIDQAVNIGILGFMLKGSDIAEELAYAIRTVYDGKKYLCQEVKLFV